MRIESYIRNKTNQYLRPLLIKDKCEICGEVEGLELHHIKSFAQLLEECLEKLGYKYYKNKNNYTDLELENIINWMLGVQLKIQYITVCKDCHTDIHNEMGGFYSTTDKFEEYCIIENMKKKLNEKRNIKNVVIPYLDSIVGEKLFKKEQNELIDIIDLRVNGRQQRSYSKLNEGLKMISLPYIILPKKSNNKRYWIVEKIS